MQSMLSTVRLLVCLAAVALLGAAPAPTSTPSLPDRFIAAGKPVFTAADKAGIKTVLILVLPDPSTEPDRRALLDATRTALDKAAESASLRTVGSPEAEKTLLEKKTAALQPVDIKSLKATHSCDAVLQATYFRLKDRRSIRLTLLDERAALATATVALTEKDFAIPLSHIEESDARTRLRAALDSALASVHAAAAKQNIKSAALAVSSDASPGNQRLSSIVRGLLETPSANQDSKSDNPTISLITSPETRAAITRLRGPSALLPRDAKRISAEFADKPDAILDILAVQRARRSTVEFSLVTPDLVVIKGSAVLDDWDLASIPDIPLINQRVLEFCQNSLGKQIGNGECWTLANEALIASGARRADGYTYGHKLADDEQPLPGDIMQFTSVRLERKNSWMTLGAPNHTAVIKSVKGPRVFEILHQNFGGPDGKKVSTLILDMDTMTAGSYEIWRGVPRQARP